MEDKKLFNLIDLDPPIIKLPTEIILVLNFFDLIIP